MHIGLTIEEARECFGDESVAKWIERGLKMDHNQEIYQALSAVAKELGVNRFELTKAYRLTSLNVGIYPSPRRIAKEKRTEVIENMEDALKQIGSPTKLLEMLNTSLGVRSQNALRDMGRRSE